MIHLRLEVLRLESEKQTFVRPTISKAESSVAGATVVGEILN
jgi:hypothetical protein